MKAKHFVQARFLKTAVAPAHYPAVLNDKGEELPEIAVVGRSNVGKSSLLNHLFQRKGLVKTSAHPGKTQTIQFFSAGDACVFVDLPGYGYAAVSESIRKQWGPMIEQYLKNRSALRLIFFLLDIRRIPSEEDQMLLSWLLEKKVPTLLILTKTDKIRRAEKVQNMKQILEALGNPPFPCLFYSTLDPAARDALIAQIQVYFPSEEDEHAA